MANTTFQIKRTTVSGRTPNTTNSSNSAYISIGELATNITDKKLFTSDGTSLVELGSNLSTLSVSGNTIIGGNLTVLGTTVTISTANFSVSDNLIFLNEAKSANITNAVGNGTVVVYDAINNYFASEVVFITGITPSSFNISSSSPATIIAANSTTFSVNSSVTDTYVSGGVAYAKAGVNVDLGWSGGYNDGTYGHAGIFRDASDGIFKVFDGYTPELSANVNIDTNHPSFSLADIAVDTLFGSLQGAANVTYLDVSGSPTINSTGYWVGPSSGIQGPQGFQGQIGQQGPQGLTGAQGPQGRQGHQGQLGPQGPQGNQGVTGDEGPQGPQGNQGYQGNTGVTGNAGAQGPQGNQGVQGVDGVNGAQGPQGFQGPQGVQGTTGSQGPQGNQGITGAQGPQGIIGQQGPQGVQGLTGAQGPQGDDGIEVANTAPLDLDVLWLDTTESGIAVVPTGGSTGQVLAKASNADYDTEWVNQTTGSGTSSSFSNSYSLTISTTNATETELLIGGVGGTRIPVGTDKVFSYMIFIVGRRTDIPGDYAGFEIKGLVTNQGGTVSDIGSIIETIIYRTNASYEVDARADDANNTLNIYATGVSGHTISWKAAVQTVEV